MSDFFFSCAPLGSDGEQDYVQRAFAAAVAENPSNDRTVSPDDGLHTKFWKPGRTLLIRFARPDGEALPLEQAQAIFSAACGWLSHANLKFELLNAMSEEALEAREEALNKAQEETVEPSELALLDYQSPDWVLHIPVRFASNDCSVLGTGTDSKLRGGALSMDLMPLDHPDFEAHVLHNFGHLLGLRFEHLHPDADIPWDVDKARERFANCGWPQAALDTYLFEKLRQGDVLPMPYDPTSIMHLGIPGSVTQNGWEQPPSKCLSPGDIARARMAYPTTE